MSVHIYGVVAASRRLPKASRGRRDAPLRLITHDDFGAVVSDIDARLPIRREDLLAHAHVLEGLIEHATVLPMRFGMVLSDDGAVADSVLSVGQDRLGELLTEFDDLVQITVKAQHDENQALRYMLAQRPDIQALRDVVCRVDAPFNDQVRLGQAVADALGSIEEHDASNIFDRLAPIAERIALMDAARPGQVLNAAMLVRRSARTQADEAIGRMRQSLPERLQLRYVGPQPPYSFLDDVVLAGELAWA